MHGEAWVNNAIQEADLLIAAGHALRRPGHRQPQDLRAQRAQDPHRHRPGRDQQERPGRRRRSSATCATSLNRLLPSVAKGNRDAVAGSTSTSSRATPRSATSRTCPTTATSMRRTSSTTSGALTEGDAIVVTDVGQHQMWEAQYYHHDTPRSLITSGGLGTMGFARAGGDWRQARPPGRGSLGGRRRRRLPDDDVRAGDGGAGGASTIKVAIINNGYLGMVRQWQEFFYERRYAATPLTGPDFVKLAEAFGISGLGGHRPRRTCCRRSPRRARHGGAGGRRLPRRAGRHRLPDGAGRRGSPRDDPPARARLSKPARTAESSAGQDAYLYRLRRRRPGVLNRVSSLFRRRNFNIDLADRRPHRDARRLAHDHRRPDRRGRRAARRGEPLQADPRASASRTSPTARRCSATWR